MSRAQTSRKKLLQEPDEFLSGSQRLWLWVHENRDRAGMIAGGIGVAVLLAVGAKAYVDRSNTQRSTAVAAAVARYVQAPVGALPATLQHELATLADRYAGSPEGAVARYFQAGALAAAGEIEKARQVYTTLGTPGEQQGDLALLSRQALAYLDLAGGNVDAALKAFQDLLKAQGGAVARAQIMMEIAAIHEKQGRAAEALRVYKDIVAEHPDGSWVAAAKDRLRLLAELSPSAS
ncbi:MAG: tetratricopeptide repeat protein [Candidatus Methylomirabilia bacterium]